MFNKKVRRKGLKNRRIKKYGQFTKKRRRRFNRKLIKAKPIRQGLVKTHVNNRQEINLKMDLNKMANAMAAKNRERQDAKLNRKIRTRKANIRNRGLRRQPFFISNDMEYSGPLLAH